MELLAVNGKREQNNIIIQPSTNNNTKCGRNYVINERIN